MDYQPLVTIVVITYNSAKFVLETLESTKAQTYQNIELIVSDDCSTDNTVEVCEKWIEENRGRFVRVELITFAVNTGISPNCNRGFNAAKGEWIKVIAGDDILLNNCIIDYIKHVLSNKEKLVLSGIIPFTGEMESPVIFPPKQFFNKSPQKQLRELLHKGTFLPGPTIFVKKEIFNILGGFDDNYSMVEDYPFFIKYTKSGNSIGLVKKPLVKWRKHSESITQFDSKFYVDINRYFLEVRYPEILNQKWYFLYWHCYLLRKKEKYNMHHWIRRVLLLIDPVGMLSVWNKVIYK